MSKAGTDRRLAMEADSLACARGAQSVRQLLHDELAKLEPDRDWGFVTRQIGVPRLGALCLLGSICCCAHAG